MKITTNRINGLLIFAIIILSCLSIIWHNQDSLYYKKTINLQEEKEKIMVQKKQLLNEHSEQMSGSKVQTNAIKKLRMQQPAKVRELEL
ncbi:MAG: hypothetical protein Ctma_0290 [Catillopecten margaritatus gill symbiont]|uniref:Cell division protein FtsL n=1 Tax=Catillopecten margaritatus gill symbiont TaxID=3083288 RepID=A0AAU6PEY7_9GAMM